mmetsp:Transcript_32530/g.36897  ORF Transcript_32530/g.36897 Transcript_32530/m.36897 type:complete len:227 (-) Transcript_32530:279-959(-)
MKLTSFILLICCLLQSSILSSRTGAHTFPLQTNSKHDAAKASNNSAPLSSNLDLSLDAASREHSTKLDTFLQNMKSEIFKEIHELKQQPPQTKQAHHQEKQHKQQQKPTTITTPTATTKPSNRKQVDQLPNWTKSLLNYLESLWDDANSRDSSSRFGSIFLMFIIMFTFMCVVTQASIYMTNAGSKWWTEFQYRRGMLYSKNEYVCVQGGRREKFYRYNAPPLQNK